MALCRAGGSILRSVKPIFINPCFVIPSSLNLPVRHAARKGYREKARRKKSTDKAQAVATKEIMKLRTVYKKIEKTVNLKKPEPPTDDVIMTDLFNYKKFTISEAVQLHREYHHPEIYNNPTTPVTLRIEINMTGKKSTQFIKPFSGVVAIPHPFVISHKREVLVFCDPEDVELAMSSGASIAGGAEVIKKIKEGAIQCSLYEYLICHVNFLPNLTPIRTLLQNQMPKAKQGTLTKDLKTAIYRFLHGIEYSCVKIGTSEDFGLIDCCIGTIDMELEQLEENFRALIADIESNRPPRDGEFITWIWCLTKFSQEQFSIDLSKYLTTEKDRSPRDDDDVDEVVSEKQAERMAAAELRKELEEERLREKNA